MLVHGCQAKAVQWAEVARYRTVVASNHKIRLQVRSFVRFSCLTRVAHPVDHDRVLDLFP